MTAISNEPSRRAVNAISLYSRDGFHDGASLSIEVRRRTLRPSSSITQIACPPLRSEVKAISRPVGLQVGAVSTPGDCVRRFGLDAVGGRHPDLHVAAAHARVRDRCRRGCRRARAKLPVMVRVMLSPRPSKMKARRIEAM